MIRYLLFITFLLSINCYSINPKKEYVNLPSDYNIEYKECSLDINNFKICMWDSKPRNITKSEVILLAYADYGNMSYYLSYIKLYTDLGYRVISFDYRGFGKSSFFEIDKDFLYYNEFIDDLDNVILYCKKKLNIEKLGIVSLSMGTILVSLSKQKYNLDFLIAEGVVYDTKDVIHRLKKTKNKECKLPASANIDPSFNWKEVKCKILLFAGKEDYITTEEDSFKIVEQDELIRKLVVFKDGHLSGLNTEKNKDIYKKTVKLFLHDE